MNWKQRIQIVQGDITRMTTDAIVNAANSSLLGGGGVDGAIHRAAGPELLHECRLLGGCKTGDAKLTKGYNLPARFIIHTVGPVWNGGHKKEAEKLASCYRKSLEIAAAERLTSIAFPAISTGIYRFPFETATETALHSIRDFMTTHELPKQVYLVFFSEADFATAENLLEQLV